MTPQELVEREVIYCVSALIYDLSKRADFANDDDLLSLQYAPQPTIDDCTLINDGTLDTVVEVFGEQYRYSMESAADYRDDDGDLDFDSFCDDVVIPDIEPNEVFEHWIVSDWLARRLEQYGGCVCHDFLGLTIWGRCTTGQAIYIDSVIERICEDLNR